MRLRALPLNLAHRKVAWSRDLPANETFSAKVLIRARAVGRQALGDLPQAEKVGLARGPVDVVGDTALQVERVVGRGIRPCREARV